MPAIYVNNTETLPERALFDFYPTPKELCKSVVRDLVPLPNDMFGGRGWSVLDPGAGTGVWGEAVREVYPSVSITGVEIREDAPRNPTYNRWLKGDFMLLPVEPYYNLVIGNPPYKLAEEFVREAYKWLAPGGSLIFLLRTEFQNGIRRARGLFTELPPYSIHPVSPRPSFIPTTPEGKRGGTAPMDYSMFVWRKPEMYTFHTPATVWSVLDWKD